MRVCCKNLDLRHGFVVNLMPSPIVLAVLSAKFEVNVCRPELKICYRKIKIELFNAIWALLKTQSKLKFDLNKDDKRLTPEFEPSFLQERPRYKTTRALKNIKGYEILTTMGA